MTPQQQIANIFHTIRVARGWKQVELADLLETKQSAISRVESGRMGASATTLQKLADLSGIPFSINFYPNK